jgi:hypothetical protein
MTQADPSIFHLILIKPTRYDEDGYPIRWMRTLIPSNSLTVLYGLAVDAAQRKILGERVEIKISATDETNTRIRPQKIIRQIEAEGGRALIGLVGVQSNQFPRAVDIARPFLEAGVPVLAGGFHVSGCKAMLPELPDDIREAQAMGLSLFIGEAEEGRLDTVIQDAFAGALKPVYDHMNDLPSMADQPTPILPKSLVERNFAALSSFDLGRGCPFQCSFCTIINVQGRKSRARSPDDLERIIRENAEQNIRSFFITDDNFARNQSWEAFLDRLIWMRETQGFRFEFFIQVDVQCHKVANFIEKCARAGVRRVYIGLENINPENLLAAKKRQNKITDYRMMLQKWKEHGIIIFAGYITGFPADTREAIARDIAIIKRELPVDCLEFFFLTPLPGSEDHQTLHRQGVWMDPDMNKYNLNHRVTHHGKMSDAEWEEAYHQAWRTSYTLEHIETAARRHRAIVGKREDKVVKYMTEFKLLLEVEGLHPLEGGIFRRKSRRDRRRGMRIESAFVFYPRYAAEIVVKHVKYAKIIVDSWLVLRRIRKDAGADYRDIAIEPVCEDELDTLAMFTQTSGGAAAVGRKRRGDAVRREVHEETTHAATGG